MHNFLHANGPQQHRGWQSRAKNLHVQVALGNIMQYARDDAPPVEGFAVGAHGIFAARPAGNVVVTARRKDFLRLGLQEMQRDGDRWFSADETLRIELQLALRTGWYGLWLLRIAHNAAGIIHGS